MLFVSGASAKRVAQFVLLQAGGVFVCAVCLCALSLCWRFAMKVIVLHVVAPLSDTSVSAVAVINIAS